MMAMNMLFDHSTGFHFDPEHAVAYTTAAPDPADLDLYSEPGTEAGYLQVEPEVSQYASVLDPVPSNPRKEAQTKKEVLNVLDSFGVPGQCAADDRVSVDMLDFME
jgi:hypothetical protein